MVFGVERFEKLRAVVEGRISKKNRVEKREKPDSAWPPSLLRVPPSNPPIPRREVALTWRDHDAQLGSLGGVACGHREERLRRGRISTN